MQNQHRQLAAILFTDIVGYTALMQVNEEKGVALIKHYSAALNRIVGLYNGNILNYYGDGSLCTFGSVTDAMNAVIALQKELQLPPAVPLRIGLHLGEVFFEEEKALGALTGTINIPLEILESKLSEIPSGKQIVITDIYGHDAAAAAKLLIKKGYNNISVLIEGMDRWISMNETTVPCKNSLYKPSVTYNLIATTEFGEWIKAKKVVRLVDIRTIEEVTNQHKDKYRNIGRIENAVHIPAAEMETRWSELSQFKNEPVVLYDFSGGTNAFTAADVLVKKGFTKVNVLFDGIFNVRWTAGNVKGWGWLSSLVKNIPQENQ